MMLAMAAGIIVARELGPELRGYFGLIYFSTNLLFSFGHLGIGTSITYFSGRNEELRQKIFAFLIISSLLIGTLLALVFFAVYLRLPGKWSYIDEKTMLIGLAVTPFLFLQDFVARFLLSMLKVKQRNILNLTRSSLYLLLIIIFIIILHGRLLSTVLSFTVSMSITSLFASLSIARKIKPDFNIGSDLIRKILKYGFKAYLIDVLNFLNYRIDIILIQHFLPINQLSFYQMAVNISERLWYIPQSVSLTLFPTLLSQKEQNSGLTEKVCKHNLFIMAIMAIPIALFGKFAIGLLYGQAYLPAAPALYAVLIGIVIYPVFKLLSIDLAANNRLGVSIFASAVGVAINVISNIYLIPRYGIVGAGVATSISYSVMTVILVFIYVRLNKISPKNLFILRKEDWTDYRLLLIKLKEKIKRR